jgi:hypothetical protein
MNVSKEADAIFMRELERMDPIRYANLIRNLRHTAGTMSLAHRNARSTGVSRRKYANLADAQAARRQQDRQRKTATS